MALGQSTKRESEENKNNTNTKTNEKGEGKGRGTNNILFNGCLNENIVSHHHTERKLLAKNDMREKERARKLKGDEPQSARQVGGARWGRSPSLPPSDLGQWAGGATGSGGLWGRPRVSKTCRDEPQAEEREREGRKKGKRQGGWGRQG